MPARLIDRQSDPWYDLDTVLGLTKLLGDARDRCLFLEEQLEVAQLNVDTAERREEQGKKDIEQLTEIIKANKQRIEKLEETIALGEK